ncbi:MAG: hypothetical protein PSV17_13865 [Methylotenera sp.]|uniref:hypothetical protein n=1 Tax=Methylotenera sp. TaxID=2051956 RepID=UPI00248A4820|nr:hypothetical protein [Methylotenera sp.]MDI1310500.1 hypothetical protein [Methylotenera sp.]
MSNDQVLPVTNSNNSAISWAAIFAGATVAAALSLILLLLGAGLGLSSVSPWGYKGVSASTFGISTIVWITVTQILAAGMGGFLAGRLRTKWMDTHVDEVYFRDTAHGFLVWAVATLATATLLASVVGSIVSGGVQSTANMVGGAMGAATSTAVGHMGKTDMGNDTIDGAMGYFVDSMFRKNSSVTSAANDQNRQRSIQNNAKEGSLQSSQMAEVNRILINSIDKKALPPIDLTYLGQLVSKHTGLSHAEAEKRVNDIFSNIQTKKQSAEMAAKTAADKARKATVYATLWLFISLLMGAFSASLAATWGGRCRDA